jgi:hypothetical protein
MPSHWNDLLPSYWNDDDIYAEHKLPPSRVDPARATPEQRARMMDDLAYGSPERRAAIREERALHVDFPNQHPDVARGFARH